MSIKLKIIFCLIILSFYLIKWKKIILKVWIEVFINIFVFFGKINIF